MMSGTDSTVAVTSRTAYSRRSAGARSRDWRRRSRSRSRQQARSRASPGRRCSRAAPPVVQRAAGVAQAAAADHRHHPPQAASMGASIRLTLSPTPPVLCLSSTGPRSGQPARAAVASSRPSAPPSRRRPCRSARWPWPSRRPGVAEAAVGQAACKGVDLRRRQHLAVALGADDLGRPPKRSRCRAPTRQFSRVTGSSVPGGFGVGPGRGFQRVDVHHAGARVACFSAVKLSPPPVARKPLTVTRTAVGGAMGLPSTLQAVGHHALARGRPPRPSCSVKPRLTCITRPAAAGLPAHCCSSTCTSCAPVSVSVTRLL